MASSASRMMLRQPKFALRRVNLRNASTAANTANAAKETASQATTKASEGLSKVTSSAGATASKIGSAAGNAIGKVGGRTGALIGRITGLVPHVVYYGKVGLELGKVIFEHRKMSPPSAATFQTYFQSLLAQVRNPSALASKTAAATNGLNPQTALQSVRSLSTEQLTAFGIVAAEVVGFFTIGEMLGRLKIVGYRGGKHAEH